MANVSNVVTWVCHRLHRVKIAYDGGKSNLHALECVGGSPLLDRMPVSLIMAGVESEARRAG